MSRNPAQEATERIDARAAIRIPRAVLEELRQWAGEGYPHETCGLLIGSQDPRTGEVRILRAARARNLNVERARDRYEMDPVDQLRAEESARESGLAVLAIWHSHPDHPALPSETDRQAAWEGWSYVILSVGASGVADVRSWRLDGNRTFFEEEVRS